ncbi:discoidin domain-containing protein [Thermocatellispora tengchongensis]
MWMMRAITGDPVIEHERLPYARNFKLAQQETAAGPFQGAALGEYFRRGGWESENVNNKTPGPNYVSPIFTTFYTLADVGNILLFGADDELRRRVRLAADRLLAWQKPDGSFDVGYLRESPGQLVYPDLTDYRATWYGLLVAHRVLGDPACLQAARRGADWFIANALRTGRFLGVCDDARLPRDFQVIFAAQALLELAEVTGEARYRHAAIETAQHYATQVYTHPTPSTQPRTFNDHEVEQWQTSQAGLSFEHAGFSGSAPSRGPILLAAHAGAFVRFAELTGEQLFLDMARAAARGRDEWVDPASGWPSYYWNAGNTESGKFPWHGWWHLGWMIDYLLAEARLRSQGRISFPRGFMTAKVGASAPYGFAAGTVYSRAARLWMPPGLVKGDNPEVDVLTAMSTQGRTLLVIALNGRPENQTATLTIDPRSVSPGELADMTGWRSVAGSLTRVGELAWKTTIPAYGHAVLSVDLTLSPDPQGQQPRSLEVTGMPRSPVVAWSYWKATTSWAEWREAGGTAWKGTPAQDGYRFRAPLDLSGVPAGDVQIRLACKASDGSVGYSQPIVHRVYDPDGPNLALGRPVEASSVYSAAYPPEKAVDGDRADTASRWLSAVGDGRPTFTVTLAAAAALRLVRVYSGGTLQRQVAVDFDVEARSGGGWTTVATVRGNTSPMADVLLSSVTADAVRLVFLRPSSDAVNVARIFEVEVYDKLK